jgi:hypothetical protein
VACLVTHFVLLRAPLTTDLSAWRATHGIVFLLTIGGIGLASCAVAAGRFQPRGAARLA